MTKREKYRVEIRSIARQIIDHYGDAADMTYSRVVIEDITARTEKTFLKELIKSLEQDIRINEKLEIPCKIHKLMLRICNSRLEVVNNF